MKVQVLQENFSKATLTASRFSSNRAQLPVLSNILLTAEANKLTVSATNLEISISIPVGAKVEKEGVLTIPSKVLNDLVINLNSGVMDLTSDKESLIIDQGSFKSSLLGMNASDFPSLPKDLGKDKNLIKVSTFNKLLAKTLFSVSFDETRPTLTGILFFQKKTSCYLVATDGFRLSRKKMETPLKQSLIGIIIPKNILNEIPRLSAGSEELEFSISEKEKQVVFKIDGTVVSSRLIEGEFPAFEKIIPTQHTTTVSINKEDFLQAVKLASVFARDSANIVKLDIGKDQVKMMSESQYAGSQSNSFEAKVEGESLAIAFNYKFLEEFVNSVEGESIIMEFAGPQSPGVFKDASDSDYLHLIMPVKI